MTRQRAAIIDAISDGDFRSAQAWHESLRGAGSAIGLATVYRTLQSLADDGDVDTVVSESGETLYRWCAAHTTHHHHLRCRSCGTAEEIDLPSFEQWSRAIASARGYTEIEHTVELTGLCHACSTELDH